MKLTKMILGILLLGLWGSYVLANAELDSEIDDLKVQIVRRKPAPAPKTSHKVQPPVRRTSYVATPVVNQSNISTTPVTTPQVQALAPTPAAVYHRHATLVADNTPVPAFEPTDSNASQESPRYAKPLAPSKQQQDQPQHENKIIREIELIPAVALSSFDGGGSSNLVPSGTSSPYNTGFSGFLLADVDFGFHNIVLETGIMVAQMGSGTGYGFSGNTQLITSEKVATTYFGVPINGKWMLSGEGNSSFFIKGGAIPASMMSHNYTSSGVNSEARFGGYNIFDLLFDVGAGYDYKLGHIHVIADISGFQGIMPVLTNYDVYNFGLLAGLGIGFEF